MQRSRPPTAPPRSLRPSGQVGNAQTFSNPSSSCSATNDWFFVSLLGRLGVFFCILRMVSMSCHDDIIKRAKILTLARDSAFPGPEFPNQSAILTLTKFAFKSLACERPNFLNEYWKGGLATTSMYTRTSHTIIVSEYRYFQHQHGDSFKKAEPTEPLNCCSASLVRGISKHESCPSNARAIGPVFSIDIALAACPASLCWMFWMLNNAVVGIGIVQRWIFAISKTRWLVKVISVFGIQATASQPTGSSLLRRLAEIRLETEVDWLDSFYSKVTSEKTEQGIGARTAVICCRCSENVTFQFLLLVCQLQALSLANYMQYFPATCQYWGYSSAGKAHSGCFYLFPGNCWQFDDMRWD